MRLVRITTNYSSYLKRFYAQHPNLREKTYAIQYHTLMADCFGWADFWTHALRPLGYEVWEPVGNAETMQKVWAREHGEPYREDAWLYDIIAAQIRNFQPELLFVDDYSTYTYDFLHSVRQRCPSIKLVVGWCGAPYRDASVFHEYDLVLSNLPELVVHFREQGHRAEYIPHGFASRVLENIDTSQPRTIECSFIGSITKGIHEKREQWLETVAEHIPLSLYSDIYYPPSHKRFMQQALYILIKRFKQFPGLEGIFSKVPVFRRYRELSQRPHYTAPVLGKRACTPVFGLSMFQTLQNSNITLNNHISLSVHFASNMRMFEATGVGTCLVTDWKKNLSELFAPEQEVITYRSNEECVEKAQWLLDHPEEREAIARAGQQRTLRDHTFAQRAIELDVTIKKFLS